jgi:hypothetical protein
VGTLRATNLETWRLCELWAKIILLAKLFLK